MAFTKEVILEAWKRSGGRCECRRTTHNHPYIRCNKDLVWDNQGREGRGKWEAHHINSNGPDVLSNCEILCFDCHTKTRSFGG